MTYGNLSVLGILLDEEQIKQRIFSNYYRVAFFGKKLLDLDGKEFIYKELNTTMLAQFTDKIMVTATLVGVRARVGIGLVRGLGLR